MTHTHQPQYSAHGYPPNPHISDEVPRIATDYKPEYRDEPKASELWIEWIPPLSGAFVMLANSVIVATVTKNIINDGYDWASHFASIGCFVMSLFALVIIYKYREIIYNIRAKQDVRRDD